MASELSAEDYYEMALEQAERKIYATEMSREEDTGVTLQWEAY
jgi:hypothetical protein